jgi:hypothetical protein
LAPCQRGLKIERIATSSQAMMKFGSWTPSREEI